MNGLEREGWDVPVAYPVVKMYTPVCPPHTFAPQPGGDACACGVTFLDWTRGFGGRTSTYEMPPSKAHRKKSAVAKRFGQAFGAGD